MLFDDDEVKTCLRIAPDNNKIAYVKNTLLYWESDLSKGEVPKVCVADMEFSHEKVIMSGDSMEVYHVEWINSELLAISSRDYLYILDNNFDVIFKEQVYSVYQLYMLPDNQHLIAYCYYKICIVNTQTNEIMRIDPDEEIATYNLPFYKDGNLVMRIYGNKYYKIDLSNYAISEESFSTSDNSLVYIDGIKKVCYNSSEKQLKLYSGEELVATVRLENYTCDIGLNLDENNEMYLVAESMLVDDEGVILKVNFDTKKVECLTNHGEDKFVIDARYYEF